MPANISGYLKISRDGFKHVEMREYKFSHSVISTLYHNMPFDGSISDYSSSFNVL